MKTTKKGGVISEPIYKKAKTSGGEEQNESKQERRW